MKTLSNRFSSLSYILLYLNKMSTVHVKYFEFNLIFDYKSISNEINLLSDWLLCIPEICKVIVSCSPW